jgi:hypothetical protein
MFILCRKLRLLKRSRDELSKQVSEHHFGTNIGDRVTGAPVIEPGYTHLFAVPNKVMMETS